MGKDTSIHNQDFPKVNNNWKNKEISTKWENLKLIRRAVNGAIEIERKNKLIGSSLEAAVEIYFQDSDIISNIDVSDLESICIVSKLTISKVSIPDECFQLNELQGVGVKVSKVAGEKCGRCWKYFDKLNQNICQRCESVIQ